MLKAAVSHRGTAMLDVISPCVTFNDHEGSTKSYDYMKDHDEPLHEIDFVPFFENIEVNYDPGETQDVEMHDGSHLRLRKLDHSYDATDPLKALTAIEEARRRNEVLTGIFYVNPEGRTFLDLLHMVDEPLATLPQERVRPGRAALEEIVEELR